jgi:hypothetical protein
VSGLARLVASACAALSLGILALAALPDRLDVTTDIVGYPTFVDFNIDRLYWAYSIAVLVVPLAGLACYLLLTRVATGRFGPWGRAPTTEAHAQERRPVTGWRVPAVAAGRTLLLGAVLGLELAIGIEAEAETMLLVAALYAVSVVLVAYAFTWGRGVVGVTRTLNVLAAPLAVGGLYLVSDSTRVTVTATGAVHHHPWLPAWLAIGALTAVYAVLLRMLRGSARFPREALERWVVLLVVAPVGLFLLVASVPGSLGPVDHFEEGQLLAGAELTRAGAFPWRDLLVTHGLLYDVFSGLFGLEVVEESRWGLVAGERLVLVPLCWVGLYYLCAYLFGGNWLYLAGIPALVVTGHLFSAQVRFLLLPAILLLLAAVLRNPRALRVVGLATVLLTQVVVTPEALPLGMAVVGAVVLRDAYHLERGAPLRVSFRRTWRLLAALALVLAAWCLLLATRGALDDWIFSYRAFVPGHRYTGGIPLYRHLLDVFELWAPIVALLAAFALAVAFSRLRRPFVGDDWVLLAAGGLTLTYYVKFLSRADSGHLFQTFAVTTPFVLYVAYRYVVLAESWLAMSLRGRVTRWPGRHTVTLPLLAILLATAPTSPLDVLRDAPKRFAAAVEREPAVARVGYDLEPANDETMIGEVGAAVSGMLDPGETVFDLSNTPALFHYLHAFPTSARYYHASLAIRLRTQTDLVEQLERTRPAVVVYSGSDEGLSGWDGIANQVRHYAVSEYLLDRYVPVREVHGFVLMQPRESGVAEDPELYFRVGACDWGHVPRFFAPRPAGDQAPLSVAVRARESETTPTWELTVPERGLDGYRWLEITTSSPPGGARFELGDRLELTRDELIASRVRAAVERGDLELLAGARALSSVPTRRIGFNADDTTVLVRVGSCAQWRGYRARTLYLTSAAPQDVVAVRLLR